MSRKRAGRPPFEPTREQRVLVQALSGNGIPHETIARLIINPQTNEGITKPTLYKVFRAELDDGANAANALVITNLFRMATGKGPQAVTAAIFWAKTRMGWKETTVVERREINNFEDLTDAELVQIMRSADDELAQIVADHKGQVQSE
jgi:hypothetical protein